MRPGRVEPPSVVVSRLARALASGMQDSRSHHAASPLGRALNLEVGACLPLNLRLLAGASLVAGTTLGRWSQAAAALPCGAAGTWT